MCQNIMTLSDLLLRLYIDFGYPFYSYL